MKWFGIMITYQKNVIFESLFYYYDWHIHIIINSQWYVQSFTKISRDWYKNAMLSLLMRWWNHQIFQMSVQSIVQWEKKHKRYNLKCALKASNCNILIGLHIHSPCGIKSRYYKKSIIRYVWAIFYSWISDFRATLRILPKNFSHRHRIYLCMIFI